MSEILFVCTGNAARSQFGQALFNKKYGRGLAESAGTEVITGKPIPSDVLAVLSEHEIDASTLYRKQISQSLFDTAAKVVVMTDKSVPDYVHGEKVVTWNIDDPRGKGLEKHEKVFDQISQLVGEL